MKEHFVKPLTLLIYGNKIPSHKHLHKLGIKFINHFMKVRNTVDFNDEEYYEVTIEEQSLNSTERNYITAPILPIHKNYLQNLLNVYGNLNATVTLCTEEHEHPLVYFNDIAYEGYCYYEWDTVIKICFFEVEGTKYVVPFSKNSSSEQLMLKYIKYHLDTLHKQ